MPTNTTHRLRPLATLGLLAALAACAGSVPEVTLTPEVAPTSAFTPTAEATPTGAPGGVATASDLVFLTRIEDGAVVTLDIHFPAEPVDAPIVIEPIRSAVDDLVEQGVIVVTIDPDDLPGDEGPGGPEEIVAARQDPPESLECAIRFARARASEVGNDDPTVVLSGVSFGGGLAVQVGLFGDTLAASWDEFAAMGGPPRQFDCEVTGGSTHVDAVVGMAGTYDLCMPIIDGMYGRAYQQEHDPEMQEFLASAIGANPDLKLRLIHGTYDEIPVSYADEFAEVLRNAGYDAQLITWAGGHQAPPTELFLTTVMEVLGP